MHHQQDEILKFEIDVACDGKEAVEQYEQNLVKECFNSECERFYKLIIMDIGMPIKDGYEASKEIFQIQNNLRKIGENDEVKINKKCDIIALTSFSDY
jgi:CheY-like chemotaxis protein